MTHRNLRRVIVLICLSSNTFAQVGGHPLDKTPQSVIDTGWSTLAFMHGDWPNRDGASQKPLDSVSKFDLAAPAKARREYERGLQELYRKSFADASAHLEKAVAIYPNYVSARDALGTAYMNLGQNERAREEFRKAISIDDHLPYSYSNLGRADLAIGDYPAAVGAIQKASAIAPLDLKLSLLLAYAQFIQKDYPAVIATAHQVHGRKHEQAAFVHYFAAAAWQAQHQGLEAEGELELFLVEDPNNPDADQVRKLVAQMEETKNSLATPQTTITYSVVSDPNATPEAMRAPVRNVLTQLELQKQVAVAECDTCPAQGSAEPSPQNGASAEVATGNLPSKTSAYVMHKVVDEVGVFFAATDAGKAVDDLVKSEVRIRDDHKSPAAFFDFRNESQLPLRLGLVIDSSASITERFRFEQNAASDLLRQVVTAKDDRVFAVGFANTVLLVQDFTSDGNKISAGLGKLAPAGGTALWDAVNFAADKLTHIPEKTPVAKILVVISDGEDNSSVTSLQKAIENAERGEIIVYAVSTREANENSTLGDRALRALAKRTGGAFFPGSLGHISRSLNELQQVIRSRYLISYKPAEFVLDGRYRPIEISAEKSGHKLRVYARKGYFARPRESFD